TFATSTFAITASAGANGAISPSGAVSLNCGVNQTFTITPNSCYHVADVQVDGSSAGATTSYTFTAVAANHAISATFALNTYAIGASAGSSGAISPSGTVVVNCGSTQTFTLTPTACHRVIDVQVDGVAVGPVTSYTFTGVAANHTITASFAIAFETIAASAG